MTTILVYFLLRSNLEWMSILRLMLQTPIADYHNRRENAIPREDGSQLLAVKVQEIMSLPLERVNDVATRYICFETRKLEGKLDVFVNLVTQLAANQKPASITRVCGFRSSNDHHTIVCPSSQQSGVVENPEQFNARKDVIVIRGVHDVATNISTETRMLEGKLDGLMKLMTQLATNQKPATIARVCDIRSPNGHHTSVCLLPSNLDWMSILRLMLQTPIGDHQSS
ncbi:hypothetical protein Fmac_015345 [Flemingia macrophylla]|uniref:Uncharacterized protein n=1 Tax=Flemingia macrophylla TaxID=520843 RepID=A0ABD1MEE1_9FABA